MIDKLCTFCGLNTSKVFIDKDDEKAWESLWALALRHRVGPVLIDRLKINEVEVPDDMAKLMSDHNKQNLHKGLRYTAELINITQLFQKDNIPFLSFKGLAFNKLAKIELSQRHTGDMDILLTNYVDIKKADKLLIEDGYKRTTLPKSLELNRKQNHYFFNFTKDIVYYHPQRKINLELHFKLFLIDETCPLSTQALYHNRSTIQIGSTTIPVMSKSDHQLYLLVHGSLCGWFRLKWLFDIPLISNNGQDYMSEAFWNRATSLGIERMVVQGLWLAHELLDMPIANYIYEYRQQNTKIHEKHLSYVEKQMEKMILSYEGLYEKVIYFLILPIVYRLSLRSNFAYKSKYLQSFLLRVIDFQMISLPSYAFWLYYPLRPFLWLRRQF